jgi:hypothetical protein
VSQGLTPRHDPGDAEPRRASLIDHDLGGHSFTDADMRGALLDGANLTGAVLGWANFTGATLTRAVLTKAVLRGAVLRRVDLTGAKLRDAGLGDADMSWTILTRADLTRADLIGTDLRDAVLTDTVGIGDVPRTSVPDLAAAILRQIEEHPETWNQRLWHTNTQHSCAGWAIVLAGPAGEAAERRLGTPQAAVLLLGGSGHPFGPDDDPRPWLRARAATENRA